MATQTLYQLAKVLRSKNSGPFEVTYDVIFDDVEKYELVKNSGIINRKLICEIFSVDESDILEFVFFDPALAFKITLVRPVASGTIGDTDVYGAQQHAPLMNIEIPMEATK